MVKHCLNKVSMYSHIQNSSVVRPRLALKANYTDMRHWVVQIREVVKT